MTGFCQNIEEATSANENFRQVLFTGRHAQLVVMCLQPGEEIGMETHDTVDQFFRVEAGTAKFVLNGEEKTATDGFAVIVPAGVQHNVVNLGADKLKLYTVYSPPNHPPGTVHQTKAEADAAERN
jgi:mannose-6-phosphate isomerase-like protein (cupin superfamily)